MHCTCNFICGLSDVIIKTFSQSVLTRRIARSLGDSWASCTFGQGTDSTHFDQKLHGRWLWVESDPNFHLLLWETGSRFRGNFGGNWKTFRGTSIRENMEKIGYEMGGTNWGSKSDTSHTLSSMGKTLGACKGKMSFWLTTFVSHSKDRTKPNQWDAWPLITFEPLGTESQDFIHRWWLPGKPKTGSLRSKLTPLWIALLTPVPHVEGSLLSEERARGFTANHPRSPN